jgi:putative ABC transport system permease protein
MLSGLRLSFRIARREAWRHRRRSALSITLLALPLIAVSFGAAAWDTTQLSDYQQMRQLTGGADAHLERQARGPIEQRTWDSRTPWTEWNEVDQDWDPSISLDDDAAAILAVLPDGSRTAPFSFSYLPLGDSVRIQGQSRPHQIDALPYDLTDPLYELADVRVAEGRPAGPGEVVLSRALARATENGVGDAVEIKYRGEADVYTVVGILERPDDLGSEFLVGPDFEHGATEHEWIVDVPGEFTLDHALALNELGYAVVAPSLAQDQGTGPQVEVPDADGIAVVALLITLVVLEVVLLSGPAFAISVKQRVREFALISAVGAAPAQLRRIVLAGGVLFGAIAAVLGIGLGVLAAYLALPLLEVLVNHRSMGFEVWPAFQLLMVVAAVGTGLLAALAAAVAAPRGPRRPPPPRGRPPPPPPPPPEPPSARNSRASSSSRGSCSPTGSSRSSCTGSGPRAGW